MNKIPQAFLNRMKTRLGNEFEQFVAAYNNEPVQSIRLNPKKKFEKFQELEEVKWYKEGKYTNGKKSFITDPLWHAGGYYVQESSSMILAEVFSQFFAKSSPKIALDLCAAPGGKSTLLQSLMDETSVLVSNEVIKSRVQILKENHIRMGISENIIITQNDPKDFETLEELFDYIQIDAPCSGEGMFRKDKNSLSEWSEANCSLCAERQKRIIGNIFPALAKGGILVYSTCTFNPKENEELMNWVCENFDFESVPLDFNPEWNTTEINYNKIFGYYFYPHKVKGEGLFISVLRKKSGFGAALLSVPKKEKSQIVPELAISENYFFENGFFKLERPELRAVKGRISKKLTIIYSGVELGEQKGKDFVPAQALANFHKNLHHFQKIEVDKNKALEFLRGKDPELMIEKNDFYLLTYKGLGLGWLKFIGNRSNNYYPKPWRIKNY